MPKELKDKLVCEKCIETTEFVDWLKQNGTIGKCDFKKAHKKPVKVVKEKRRGSFVTVILYVSEDSGELKKICSELKQRLACGGSVKEGHIELQGDHVDTVKAQLKQLGIK